MNVVLQDDGLLSEANHSTGILTPKTPAVRRKTRQVASALEASGAITSLVEFRLNSEQVIADEFKAHVALFGVDSPSARRLISGAGWRLAIDAGLGVGPEDFDSILVHRFPGPKSSDEIPAWKGSGDVTAENLKSPALQELLKEFDSCGVVELAGSAVGASYVGVVAAAIAVSEAVKASNGGKVSSVVRVDLGPAFVERADWTAVTEPPAVALDAHIPPQIPHN